MNSRRLLTAILLASGTAFLAAQLPPDLAAQDTKAEKKKALLQKKGRMKEEAKPDADKSSTEAKPMPKENLTETKPAKPIDATAASQLIDREINKKLGSEADPLGKVLRCRVHSPCDARHHRGDSVGRARRKVSRRYRPDQARQAR